MHIGNISKMLQKMISLRHSAQGKSLPDPDQFPNLIGKCSGYIQEAIHTAKEIRESSPSTQNQLIYRLGAKKLDLYEPYLSNQFKGQHSYLDIFKSEWHNQYQNEGCTQGYLSQLLYRASILSLPLELRHDQFKANTLQMSPPTIPNDTLLLDPISFLADHDLYAEFNFEPTLFNIIPVTGPLTDWDIGIAQLFGVVIYGTEIEGIEARKATLSADGKSVFPHELLHHDLLHFVDSTYFEDMEAASAPANQNFSHFLEFSNTFLTHLNQLTIDSKFESAHDLILAYFILAHEHALSHQEMQTMPVIEHPSRYTNSKDSKGLLPVRLHPANEFEIGAYLYSVMEQFQITICGADKEALHFGLNLNPKERIEFLEFRKSICATSDDMAAFESAIQKQTQSKQLIINLKSPHSSPEERANHLKVFFDHFDSNITPQDFASLLSQALRNPLPPIQIWLSGFKHWVRSKPSIPLTRIFNQIIQSTPYLDEDKQKIWDAYYSSDD